MAFKTLSGSCGITAAPGTSYAFGTITNTGLTLKADDKKLDSKYVTADTVYVQVKGDSARIETSVAIGGLNYVTTAATENLYTVTKTAGGNTQIVAVVIAGSTLTTAATDLLYVPAASTTENADGYVQTVYNMAGEKFTVTVADGSVTGFVTYTIDKDGVYTVVDATGSLAANVEWNKTIAKLEGVKYAKSFYADAMNLTDGTYTLSDIPADKLVVVDLRVLPTDKNGYLAPIASIADMQAAMGTFYNGTASYYYAVQGDVYVGLSGAVIFFVTGTVQGASV